MEKGYLAIILHAHLPFVRHPEHRDSLEENWFYEAVTETYIPLLTAMENLIHDGIDFRLTMSITPTLASMLTDPFLQDRYLRRLDNLIELGGKEVRRTRTQPALHDLAAWYHNHLLKTRDAFVNRYDRNLILAFNRFQEAGVLEIMASAATHGYLPLLSVNSSSVKAQTALGIQHYRELFGSNPKGFWLPECGYYPGVDQTLRKQGISYTILETHGITRGCPRPRYGVYAPVYCPSGLAVFGRDPESSRQVWSAADGYPGDHDYREFYRDIAYDLDLDYIKPFIHPDGIRIDTGFKYYRITGKTDHKEVYVPEKAAHKAAVHAGNFMFNREKQTEHLASVMDRKPVIVAPYDAELFGHWWYEGPLWLEHLFRKISNEQDTIRTIHLSEYLEEYPANVCSVPSISSWGFNGFNETWLNGKNDWIYPHLHQGAAMMEEMVEKHPRADGITLRALKQAARELLLAQSSDWAFMINTGTTTEYGIHRTRSHLARFHRLNSGLKTGNIDAEWLSSVENRNNIFPGIDYSLFAHETG
ncbi:MAG TPA: DUF1957 domain-containing protein [Thermodesulfobacteriaceae bacterium]|nr:DUF1957 domain-containing protein [Thermodesulfobacteriaceae bacterium]